MREEIIANETFSIVAEYPEEDFDYYSNVLIELNSKGERNIIYKDNSLELYNIVRHYQEEGIPTISDELDVHKLGGMLNDIYVNDVYVNDIDDKYNITQYCAYEGVSFCTWLFEKNDLYYLLITPVYNTDNDNDNDLEYERFKQNYADLLFTEISRQELTLLREKILKLYEKLI